MSPLHMGDVCVLTDGPPALWFLEESTPDIRSSLKLDDAPLSVALHRDRRKAYAGIFNRGLVVHSLDGGRILATVKTKPGIGPCPEAFGFTPDGSHLLVIDTQPVDLCWGTVIAVRVDDDSVASTSRVELYRLSEEGIESSGSGSVSLAFSTDGKRAFVALPTMSHISVLDVASCQPLRTIRLGERVGALVAGTRGSTLAIPHMGNDGPLISIVDTATEQVARAVRMASYPGAMCRSADEDKLYAVTDRPESSLNAIDLSAGESVASVPLEHPTSALAASPDGKRVFVASVDSPQISVITTEDHSVAAAVELRAPASRLWVSLNGQRLYAAHADQGTVSVLDLEGELAELAYVKMGPRPRFVAAFSPSLSSSEASEAVGEGSSMTGSA